MAKIVLVCPHFSQTIYTKAALSIWGQSIYCSQIIFPESRSESLAVLRNEGVEMAFQKVPDLTHLLFLDGDEIFPAQMTPQLLEHDKDIVAAWTVIRQNLKPNVYKVLYKNKRGGYQHKPYSKKHIKERLEQNKPLEKIDRIGFGSVLIKKEVFEKLEQPWFWFDEHHGTEDLFFCDLARNHGFDLWVDWSLKCLHISLVFL